MLAGAFCLDRRPLFFLVGNDSLRQRVAVDAKDLGCLAEVIAMSDESSLNIDSFELVQRLLEQNLSVEHFVD